MKYTLLLWFVLPLLAVMCEVDDPPPPVDPLDQLPPATQTGAYTFGCLVNGEAFVTRTTTDITAIYQREVLQMGGEYDGGPGEYGITLDVRSSLKVGGKYDLTNDPFDAASYGGGGMNVPTCQYEEENTISGMLTITHFDSVNFIISGTFEFVTANNDPNCDTIRVTDGRFDTHYIP